MPENTGHQNVSAVHKSLHWLQLCSSVARVLTSHVGLGPCQGLTTSWEKVVTFPFTKHSAFRNETHRVSRERP